MAHHCSHRCEPSFPTFATVAIHHAQSPEQWNSKAVAPPITLSVSFKVEPGKDKPKEHWRHKQEEMERHRQEEHGWHKQEEIERHKQEEHGWHKQETERHRQEEPEWHRQEEHGRHRQEELGWHKQEEMERQRQEEPEWHKQEEMERQRQEEHGRHKQEELEKDDPMPGKKGYKYTRFGNPNRRILEEVVAALDGGKHCLAYSSGMAAILNISYLLKPGDKIICTDDVYAGTRDLFDRLQREFHLKVRYVDLTKPKNLETALTPDTKLVWLESPTNPTLKVIDIKACADIVHKHPVDPHKFPKVLLAVDNSLMSPYLQRPLCLGADICMTSATKYINGHGDVLLGVVSVNNEEVFKKLKTLQSALGAVPSPFDCYMCNRGLKTLHVRMKQHCQSAHTLAEFLKFHHCVEKLIYPGLHSHPQHKVAEKQTTGSSGVMSFYIKGNINNAFAFLKSLKVFIVGYSLGGFESLAEHPATMTHAFVSDEIKKQLGITDTLIRLSVGLEDVEELKKDLDQALRAACA